MQRDLFHGSIAFGERNAAELGRRIDGENHLLSWNDAVGRVGFAIGVQRHQVNAENGREIQCDGGRNDERARRAGAEHAQTLAVGGYFAVQRNIIDRVARVSRVSFAENFTGLPASSVLPDGSTITYGTLAGLVSISCTSGTSRESNL